MCVSTPHLLARADLLFLLADMLRPPDQAGPRLATIEPQDLHQLITASAVPDATRLLQAITEACLATRALDSGPWSDEYHRLFEGAMVCPLNETAYVRRDKGAILGDLAGYYRAFGWNPAAHTAEKGDHLVIELQFTAVLLAMEAQAEGEAADVTADALASFAADHLHDWIGVVCQQIQAATILPYYRAVADGLLFTWQSLVLAHGWPVTAPSGVRPVGATDSEASCECGHPAAPRPAEG